MINSDDQACDYSSKIDVNAMNKSGWTALDIHFLAGNPTNSEIGYILRNAGAKLGKEAFVEADEPSWVSTRRDTFMVVASLIATMAFQVGVSPPGGVWPDNTEGHVAGKALLAFTNPNVYHKIMVANTFVFFSSISTILLLIFTLPDPRRSCRWIRAAITWWTFVSLTYTYILSVNGMSPENGHLIFGIIVTDAFWYIQILWITVMTILLVRRTKG